MNKEELAWAAGFFDGEGSIGTYFNRPHVDGSQGSGTTRLTITQKDRRPLDRFREAVGVGSVTQRQPDAQHDYGMYALQVVKRAGVHQIIWLLWPWLSEPKREQIERACK